MILSAARRYPHARERTLRGEARSRCNGYGPLSRVTVQEANEMSETLPSDDWRAKPCKEWAGSFDRGGYGKRYDPAVRRMRLAHRMAWIEAYGPIPPETPCVLHRCDNPACYEVAHLFLGTIMDNVQDMISKGRGRWQKITHCVNGHEFTPENTSIKPCNGQRCCKACNRENQRRVREKRKQRRAAES